MVELTPVPQDRPACRDMRTQDAAWLWRDDEQCPGRREAATFPRKRPDEPVRLVVCCTTHFIGRQALARNACLF